MEYIARCLGRLLLAGPKRVENDDLSRNMARNLEKLYSAAEGPRPQDSSR